MADLRLFASASNLIRFTLKDSTTGQGLTGLTNASSGLIISTIADVEASATTYTVAASHVQTIATLGTFAAPSASNCRFKEVDSTNHPGLYEFQFADARFSVSSAKRLVVSVSGAASLLSADYEIELVQFNPFDAVRMGLTALPNATAGANTGLPVVGTQVPNATAGAANGLTIAGTNAATSFASGSHFIGTVDTLTTYTGNALQTGDNYTRIGANGSSLTSLAPASTALSTVQWTNALATALATLAGHDPGGTLASHADITGISSTTAAAVWTVTVPGAYTSGQAGNVLGNIATGTPPSAAAIATAVWQDNTAGDFIVASSIGKSLYTGNRVPGAASGLAIVGSNMGSVSSVTTVTNIVSGSAIATDGSGFVTYNNAAPPTPAAIATGVWQDATAGDFTVPGSIGKSLGGAFTALGTSIYTLTALQNTPASGAPVTVGGYASGQDPYTLVVTAAMTESYAAKGVRPTLAQALYAILQKLYERSVAGTTESIKGLDGVTVKMTETLNDPTLPTAVTRAS